MAVSGGPDSLALLLLAVAALPGRVEAATVDHGLRPESAGEAATVARLCGELRVPHQTLAVAVGAGNLQDRARSARYAALGEWCRKRRLGALATGHQLDDQAETLVMRLNRGSGLGGLAGVRARGTVPGSAVPLLRPLLGWRRADLETLVAEAGIEPARDPSNVNDRFDRARVRTALAGADWLDPESLAKSARLLAEAGAYVEDRLDAAWRDRVTTGGNGYVLAPGTSTFETAELARRIIAAMGGEATRAEAAELVARLQRGENASLGGVLVRPDRDEWIFAPEPPRRTG